MQYQQRSKVIGDLKTAMDPSITWMNDLDKLITINNYLQSICDSDQNFASRSMDTNVVKIKEAIAIFEENNKRNNYNPMLQQQINQQVLTCKSTLANISRNIPVWK